MVWSCTVQAVKANQLLNSSEKSAKNAEAENNEREKQNDKKKQFEKLRSDIKIVAIKINVMEL